eukprot:TRINITY_DN4424_c0_g1_i2.p1 TRINITY_DN4424_c0_g1~~TRINITY_DN4424_c0_g1_i2.p1  ORF type:complete len:507 (+),score=82.71 TRINITY_DN4424_c0_g1_i2:1570-3090(+)
MMQVSSSTNSMEGIECSQVNGSSARLSQNGFETCSQLPINYKTLTKDFTEPSPIECEAYDRYTHLNELISMWKSKEWPEWRREHLVRPCLQSLEMTFKLISSILCDTRSYIDKEEWKRRLESCTCSQLELVSMICEDDYEAPTEQLSVSSGLLATRVSQEVWQRPGSQPVISRTSEESLLPRLGKWKRAEDMVFRIWLAIECHMKRTPFTLGLGEPNLSGKPILDYDKICKPSELHSLKQQQIQFHNPEDRTLCTVHQIFEAWISVAKELLNNLQYKIDCSDHEAASRDCWLLEKIWKLLAEVQNLLLAMDPDDLLRLKHQLAISNTSTPAGAYCLRSNALRELTDGCKELRHLVPSILGVEADPKGGPRLQEAVMYLLHSHGFTRRECTDLVSSRDTTSTIHLLMGFQAVEAAVKTFFFSYQQLVITVMGSVEMKGLPYQGASDALSQIYFEPSYFPSVDGAKTFLSEYWHQNSRDGAAESPQNKHTRKSNAGKATRPAWVSSQQ